SGGPRALHSFPTRRSSDLFDPELSKKVIELFHERMRDEIDFDPALLHSLMQHVFAQILQGHSADQALGLKAIKGKYNRPDNTERSEEHTSELQSREKLVCR